MNSAVTVWDHEHAPPHANGTILYWRGYSQERGGISIPDHLEKNADRLRAKYIEFVHDLGEFQIAGKHVVDHLAVGGGLSLWWMTQIAEKSPFKSPRLFCCLRLLALEDILRKAAPSCLTLASADRELAHSMRALCTNLEIDFRWRSCRARPATLLRRIYRQLPYCMQGLLSMRHIARRWILRRLPKPEWFGGSRSRFFCTYFFNLDDSLAERGEFQPRQWQGLPSLLRQEGIPANWLHLFLPSPSLPNPAKAASRLLQFSHDPTEQGFHSLTETYLSCKVALHAIALWLRLNVIAWRLRSIHAAFYAKDSAAWLWPLLAHDWKASLTGTVAVNNCLWIELFDTILAQLPKQASGFYLWENQGWESAFLDAWQRHGHGRIIGVPHATTVYWHLNNFDAPTTFMKNGKHRKPLPDLLAVNGPMAREAFRSAGYPSDRMTEVEALRFQYLSAFNRISKPAAVPTMSKHILILGDFTRSRTLKMLSCMAGALHLTGSAVQLTLKSHPVCPFAQADFPALEFDLTTAPLADVVSRFDAAFSTNTSSAGLDALLAGLPVIVFLDDNDFNLSPLRGVAGARFAATPEELADALRTAEGPRDLPAAGDFFCLDPALPRWRRLLSSV